MIEFTFIEPDGTEVPVRAKDGDSVMKVALNHGVQGINADCNGSAACATCHAFFADDILADLPPMDDNEDDLLSFAASERQSGSRLSCQIPVSAVLSGQKIVLPPEQ